MDSFPVITFDSNDFNVGNIVKGQLREVTFHFTNTGPTDLLIEIATSCKCAEIFYPSNPIPPGGRGKIIALYDTTSQELGKTRKVIDIIANTDPIVVEAIFHATIVDPH